MAEYIHASHTDSDPQAHFGALRPRPEHAGDRPVLGLLRRGGAARARGHGRRVVFHVKQNKNIVGLAALALDGA